MYIYIRDTNVSPLTLKFVMYENQKLKVTGKMVFIYNHEMHHDL